MNAARTLYSRRSTCIASKQRDLASAAAAACPAGRGGFRLATVSRCHLDSCNEYEPTGIHPANEVSFWKARMAPDSTKFDPATGDDKQHPADFSAPVVGRHRTVRIVATAAAIVAATYVSYQRFGTSAQANEVEFTANLSGGFLAVGMTNDHPGFIVLSALDREAVDVRADRYANAVAGDFTVAEVCTPQTAWHRRLRGPVVVVVGEKGDTKEFAVDWSVAEFTLIRDGADCTRAHVGKHHRCGAPFADLFDLIADERLSRVPPEVREFLAPHARPRGTAVDPVHSVKDARAVSAGLGG